MPRQSIHYEELMGNIEARTLLPQSPLFPDYWHLKGHYPSHTLAKGRKKQNKKNEKKGPFFSDQISAVHQSECFPWFDLHPRGSCAMETLSLRSLTQGTWDTTLLFLVHSALKSIV